MEGRDPSGLSNLQQQQQQHPFSAILQRPIHPQHPQQQQSSHQQQSPGIHHFPSPQGSLHAPSALRPASSPLASPSLSGASGGFSGDASPMAFSPQQQPQGQHQQGQQQGMARPGEPVKRKRGRPRKYGDAGAIPPSVAASGSSVSLALTPLSSVNPISSPPSTEKRRGRPPGSGRKQQLAALGAMLAGSAGQGFTPHVITIAAGEDVATKIMSFSQTGPRAVCVLSANGAISNVTLRQPATSGGTVTYEGRFEILSLSGSFLLTESGGTRSRTGGLSVSLAGPDGRVVGGGVAGLLMAASPVQVVVGSFIADTRKSVISRGPLEGLAAGQGGGGGGGGGASGSGGGGMQRVSKIEASGARSPESPHMEQQQGGVLHSPVQGMGGLQSLGWSSGQSLSEPRRDTDINIPLPGG